MKKIHVFIAIGISAIISGCEKPQAPMPEINEENCKPANIAALDPSIREIVSSKCIRIGSFEKSTPKKW
ncbi:entry exclusion lipoprotein TrbK [Aeromonas caviae]|uniref:entry exclusion lipoprotein TrbK n=1 Tax=Aeromonas caviae TaxID=648 RepID=UPI002259DDBB|nr:entry exclusion lipoprotein TrbK [Aeromonas caviae]MCX4038142.1 entry exclusion lipoprotein TrbK [Aeromonas caviae]